MKKISKNLISLAIISLLALPLLSIPAPARAAAADLGLNEVSAGLDGSLTNNDPRTIIGRIITVALGFLGVIATIIILIGGFKWMTAGGNEEKTNEAKQLLGAGVIGLVIILASWGIANYFIGTLSNTMAGS